MGGAIINSSLMGLVACIPLSIAGCGSDGTGSASSVATDSPVSAADQVAQSDPPADPAASKTDQSADTSTTQTDQTTMSDPSTGDDSFSRGVVLYFARNDQINQAYDYLNAQIANNSSDVWTRYYLAMAYQAGGDLQNAASQLAGAVNIAENPLLYSKLGDLYAMLGQQGLAQAAFANAVRLDPSYAGMVNQKLASMNAAKGGR